MKTVSKCILAFMVIVSFFISNVNKDVVPINEYEKVHQFILSAQTCRSFFSCSPDEVSETLSSSPWVDGHFRAVSQREDGYVIIELTDYDVIHWKNYFEQVISKRVSLAAQEGNSFSISDSFHTMTISVDRQSYKGNMFVLSYMIPVCGSMQMLNGENTDDWYVDVFIVDIESGKTIKEGRLPADGSFSVKDEDWDKALGA